MLWEAFAASYQVTYSSMTGRLSFGTSVLCLHNAAYFKALFEDA